MLKQVFSFLVLLLLSFHSIAQENAQDTFWQQLNALCGKSFQGKITSSGKNKGFDGQSLVMHVKKCGESQLKIPFFVGDDRSRTWVLTKERDAIILKHDHRTKTGVPEEQSMYGGKTSNSGKADRQFFPADQQTCDMIDFACFNVWWMTIDKQSFTYNLRRIGSDRLFTVTFDLTQEVENPESPWGWED